VTGTVRQPVYTTQSAPAELGLPATPHPTWPDREPAVRLLDGAPGGRHARVDQPRPYHWPV